MTLQTKLLGFTFSLLTIFSYAQQPNSLCWKLYTTDGNTGYLYGSIHLSNPVFTEWPSSLKMCFDASDRVAGELDLTAIHDQIKAAQMLVMPDSTLAQFYHPADYTFVKQELKKKLDPMSYFMVDKVKPLFTLSLLSESQNTGKQAFADIPDYKIQQWALAAQKEVIGLETMEEQISAIDQISCRDQATALLIALRQGEGTEEKMKAITDLYLRQDIHALLSLFNEGTFSDAMRTSLIEIRNSKMAEKLDALLKVSSVFCVVGAGHLAGESGMIRQMEKRGYTVEPVFFTFGAP